MCCKRSVNDDIQHRPLPVWIVQRNPFGELVALCDRGPLPCKPLVPRSHESLCLQIHVTLHPKRGEIVACWLEKEETESSRSTSSSSTSRSPRATTASTHPS